VRSQIKDGVCTSGVVGGVGIILSPEPTAMFAAAGMLAADGRCKTMDAAADGYVRAEAAGIMILQSLTAASATRGLLAILGSAVNQDGRSSGLTAPNGPAQQDVIRSAMAACAVDPDNVMALQMHGTGTALVSLILLVAVAVVHACWLQQQLFVCCAGGSH